MEHVVYILYSPTHNKNYTGHTSNLILRIVSHNIFGKDHTAKFRPWVVIYVEFFNNKISAMKREKYFKSGRGSLLKNKIIEEFYSVIFHKSS
jgi:putative endonuclease